MALLGIIMSVQMAFAQQNMLIVGDNDEIYAISVSSINYATFTFVDKSKNINGHKFVDLALPSRLLWAETNIGAEKPADVGNYYAWGETSTKSIYSEDTYSNYGYYSVYGGKTTLEKQHDAAYVNWGDSCRMPTLYEFFELVNSANCTWTWTSMTDSEGSSVSGYKVTSVRNDNSIFFPVTGYYMDEKFHDNLSGEYWSSTLNEGYEGLSSQACKLYIDSSKYQTSRLSRDIGIPVRPVAEP